MNIYFDMIKNNNLDDGALKNGEEGLLELSSSSAIRFDPFARYSVVVAADFELFSRYSVVASNGFDPFARYSVVVAADFERFARYWLPLTLGL